MSARCAVCDSAGEAVICVDCADELDCPDDLVPEQIFGSWNRASDGVLFDRWGRAFRLEDLTPIGRHPARRGLSILHATVSRHHATITRESTGEWFVIDHQSTNATRVNDTIVARCALVPNDRVAFGEVAFYFQRDLGTLIEADHDLISMRTRPPVEEYELQDTESLESVESLPKLRLRFVEAPSGGGGYLHLHGQQLRLSGTQFAMLLTLARRMMDESQIPTVVRGFVRSAQLIAELPWEASLPCEAHLKQLVRRTRKLLSAVDADLIESRRGFGYRLRAMPQLVLDRA